MVELLGIINQNQGANIVHSVLTCIFLWSLQVRYDTGGYGAVMLWYSTGPVWEWVRFGTVWVDPVRYGHCSVRYSKGPVWYRSGPEMVRYTVQVQYSKGPKYV